MHRHCCLQVHTHTNLVSACGYVCASQIDWGLLQPTPHPTPCLYGGLHIMHGAWTLLRCAVFWWRCAEADSVLHCCAHLPLLLHTLHATYCWWARLVACAVYMGLSQSCGGRGDSCRVVFVCVSGALARFVLYILFVHIYLYTAKKNTDGGLFAKSKNTKQKSSVLCAYKGGCLVCVWGSQPASVVVVWLHSDAHRRECVLGACGAGNCTTALPHRGCLLCAACLHAQPTCVAWCVCEGSWLGWWVGICRTVCWSRRTDCRQNTGSR